MTKNELGMVVCAWRITGAGLYSVRRAMADRTGCDRVGCPGTVLFYDCSVQKERQIMFTCLQGFVWDGVDGAGCSHHHPIFTPEKKGGA